MDRQMFYQGEYKVASSADHVHTRLGLNEGGAQLLHWFWIWLTDDIRAIEVGGKEKVIINRIDASVEPH